MLQIKLILGKGGDDKGGDDDHHGGDHDDDDHSSTTSSTSTSTSTSSTTSRTSDIQTTNTPPPPPDTMTDTRSMTTSTTHTSSPSSHSPTQTSQSSKPSQTAMTDSSLTIHFAAPSNVSTCDSTTFFWTPVGPSNTISLSVTNSGASNDPSAEVISTTLTKSVSTDTQLFTWFDVDVTQGWYLVQAQLAAQPKTTLAKSAPFFVENGTDTSCVRPHTQTSPTPTPTPPPGTGGGHVPSEIIGVVIAAIAACAILLVAFLFPRWWRRALPSNRKRRLLY
ncbi:hypothetical protein VKT23_013123 [Stygiomarasmius scandens]|uniref:Uncharacterized protein n=1 Tax=Marasmiellus scandens TaxID=2682957 RepID=A0ABR1J4X2_9AGAR